MNAGTVYVSVWQRYAKALAALIGGLTPAAVLGVLAMFNVTLSMETAALICTIASTVAAPLFTAVAPRNVDLFDYDEPDRDVDAGTAPAEPTTVPKYTLHDPETRGTNDQAG